MTNCYHPSFAIVHRFDAEIGDDVCKLFCYECGESMPFANYSVKEWKEILEERRAEKIFPPK